MIVLTTKQYKQIITHCINSLPAEGCGLIGGVIKGQEKIIMKIYPLTNIDNSPEHFSMNPQEQFDALKDIRNNGWILLGNFHSHPNSDAIPSKEDIRLAFDSNLSYLIVSLKNEKQPILKGYKIENSSTFEEEIQIVEGV
ncbi:M67 family metallopeptidase [Caldicellulosiruptoraceae bacterium PP1]